MESIVKREHIKMNGDTMSVTLKDVKSCSAFQANSYKLKRLRVKYMCNGREKKRELICNECFNMCIFRVTRD